MFKGLLIYVLEFESRAGIDGIEVETEGSVTTDPILPEGMLGGKTFGVQGRGDKWYGKKRGR